MERSAAQSAESQVVQEKVLHPDGKDRVGLGTFLRLLAENFGGRAPSSFTAQLLSDNTILLRPKVEVDPEDLRSLSLSGPDRDAFLDALLHPPAPSSRLRAAFRRHKERSAKA